MKLLFQQRLLSLLDSYDIYGEDGNVLYTVHGRFALAHRLEIRNAAGVVVGMVEQEIFTLLPRFTLYGNGRCLGSIRKELTLLRPRYQFDYNGWHVEGSFLEWDYTIRDRQGMVVATIGKELFHWTDTYVIDVARREDALMALMFVLAVDAEKCSRN